jgi:glycosyltransferase involved in cell wall biosynthesis
MKRQAGAIYWLLAKADRIVAPSDYLGQACRDLGFRAHIIPNIIGIDHYQFRDRSVIQPRLFWLRALHPTYNPQLAIKTLNILRRTYPEAALTMAGPDKGELEDCQKLVSELALKGAVHFTGFLNKEQINSIACEHDIFLNTARIDNCPVTVLEAMAMGLPVVSTKIGGLPFLLRDNEEALLVGDDNPVEMAKAVICLVKDSQLVKRLTMAARAKVEGYTWPTVRPLWLSVLAGRRINGSRSIERPAANIQS